MRRAASRLCLALLPAGVAWPPTLLRTPVVSYTTFSPSPPDPSPEGEGGGGQSVSVALSGRLPRPGFSPAPCPMECGLSSTPRRSSGPRPSGQPEDMGIIPSDSMEVNLSHMRRTESREQETGNQGSCNQGTGKRGSGNQGSGRREQRSGRREQRVENREEGIRQIEEINHIGKMT